MTDSAFRKMVSRHHRHYRRDLPWRHKPTPYRIVISEIMLQQTQAGRIAGRFERFVKRFPSFDVLARASARDVLREWQGLGYNRRALHLQRLARMVMEAHGGRLPMTYDELCALPGIGPNTAGSIMAFAFNIPRPFIETNIRSAYIHFFFPEIERRRNAEMRAMISDKELMPIIGRTLAMTMKSGLFKNDAREWYYALMDLGAHLKRVIPNPSRRSAHYVRQSRFEGSNRQIRSRILKLVLRRAATRKDVMQTLSGIEAKTLDRNLATLTREGFLRQQSGTYRIPRISRTISP